MLCLQVKNIHKSFTEKPLLAGVDFSVHKGQKVALVAKNGAGKSTLLQLLQGHIEPSQGEIVFHKNMTVRFLSQTFDAPGDMSVWDAIFTYNNHKGQLLQKYHILAHDDGTSTQVLQDLLHQIEQEHAWEYETKAKRIMSQLQLTPLSSQALSSLSGGEIKRVALARVLIDEPDFLVLDEPTNHLDLEHIEWLEKYLTKSTMTLLMVTHDRYFLERVCSDIYELDRGVIHSYKGNYANFLTKKSEREEQERSNMHKLKQLYKQELAWIRKAPRARESKAVDREKNFYDLEGQFKTRKKRLDEQSRSLSFSTKKTRLGSKVLKLHNVYKSFGDKKIVAGFTHDFKQGERVGIMGKNGVGKSSFIRMLMGKLPYDSGSIEMGSTVRIGYYQQKHALLDTEKTVIEFVRNISNRIEIAKGKMLSASQILEQFLFSPRQQQVKISRLSGGEKRRLQLLSVLVTNPNFLILDEPTNDLDLVTLGVLENFLLAYEGCLIIISHDRFFMDKVVDHLFVFEGEGKVVDFWGSYSEYKLQSKQSMLMTKEQENLSQNKTNTNKQSTDNEPITTFSAPPKKLSYKEKTEFEQLNKDIHKLEERKHEINVIFQQEQTPDHMTIKALGKELSQLLADLEQKETRRLELADRA